MVSWCDTWPWKSCVPSCFRFLTRLDSASAAILCKKASLPMRGVPSQPFRKGSRALVEKNYDATLQYTEIACSQNGSCHDCFASVFFILVMKPECFVFKTIQSALDPSVIVCKPRGGKMMLVQLTHYLHQWCTTTIASLWMYLQWEHAWSILRNLRSIQRVLPQQCVACQNNENGPVKHPRL